MRNFWMLAYYSVFQFLPRHIFPGGRLYQGLRGAAVRRFSGSCGEDIIVRPGCYIGDGQRLTLGDRSELGHNAHIVGLVSIGSDVLMGPDVVIMATSHEYARLDIPISQQGEAEEKPITIGDGCWIGTRAIILPGVEIGHDSIVAAGSVVTGSFAPYSIVGGMPARLLKMRTGERVTS